MLQASRLTRILDIRQSLDAHFLIKLVPKEGLWDFPFSGMQRIPVQSEEPGAGNPVVSPWSSTKRHGFVLRSSNGSLHCSADGYVDVERSRYNHDEDGKDLSRIVRVDVLEFVKFWGHYPTTTEDILDFGFWYLDDFGNTHYGEASAHWRREIAGLLNLHGN